MYKSLARKWVKALESGDYAQAQDYLCIKDKKVGYRCCCLGVLADISGIGEWKELDGLFAFKIKNRTYYKMLPRSFCREVGLPEPYAERLASMNDYGKSFKNIAKEIRKEYNIK